MKDNKLIKKIKHILLNNLVQITFLGGFVGIIVGLLIWGYAATFEHMEHCTSVYVYDYVHDNPFFIPLLFLGLIILAVLSYLVIRFVSKQSSGCGIPYTEAQMRGLVHAPKKKGVLLLIGTFLSSFFSMFAGIPLDGEGSATKMGGIIGELIDDVFSKTRMKKSAWKRFMITGGASAALAVASNAPLTGIMFSLEEGHKKFSPTVLLSTVSAVLCGIVTRNLLVMWTGFGSNEHFLYSGKLSGMIPFNQIWMLLILGIVIGFISTIFGIVADKTNDWVRKHKPNRLISLISIFVITGIVGLTLKDALFSGATLVNKVLDSTFSWQIVLLLFVVRFILVILAIDCKATGGLFYPMLALGSLIGWLLGYAFTFIGMDPKYIATIVVISMAAFFSSVVRAPLTGILLIVELTGEVLTGFFETGIVVFIAYLIISLFDAVPIYDSLIDDDLEIEREGKVLSHFYLEQKVENGSFIEGREIRDILWPEGVIIVEVEHANKLKINESESSEYISGNNIIRAGDIYHFNIKSYDRAQTENELNDLFRI